MGGASFQCLMWRRKKRVAAILCHKSLCFVPEKVHEDKKGRHVLVVRTIGNVNITILNLYAPNEEDPGFFKEIATLLAENAKGIIIVGGDFNCVVNQRIDKQPPVLGPQTRKAKALCNMIEELGLTDIWRLQHPRDMDFTFFSKVHKSYSRIDLFCVSKQDAHKVTDCHIEPTTISDHGPVVMSIKLEEEKYYRYWRLNVSLLNNPEVVQSIREELNNYLEHNDNGEVSVSTVWEAAKAVLRGKIIALSSRLKKEREKKQLDLETCIRELERDT